MNDFIRNNKVTGVYWLKGSVENIKIRVKLKPQDGLISLPKLEEFSNKSNVSHYEKIQEYPFKWQEKSFCTRELVQYSDVHKCITDTELTYHNMILNTSHEPSKVFTYIHDDYHLPFPNSIRKEKKFDLSSCMNMLRLNEKADDIIHQTSSMGHLFRSEENIDTEDEWTAMHVMLDNSEYNEDSQLLMRQEIPLVSLYHNKMHNYLILSPDVNDLELNPYVAETVLGVPLGYEYSVDVDFEEMGNSEELTILLRKLLKKWEKRHKYLTSFSMPPLDKRVYCVSLDIQSASGFDMDDLYLEYNIKIPETIHCNGDLHGRTHTSKALRIHNVEEWNFGYIIDLGLEMPVDLEPPPIQIFFEVISTDWWGRHRSEGYSYLPLTLDLGSYHKRLTCSRPEEKDWVQAEGRRFFVGGCHLIKDLDVLAKPQLQDANFTFTTTGTISLQWNIMSQTHIPRVEYTPLPSTSSASAVLLGAEAVLRQYRKARAKLAAATKDLNGPGKDGSGDG
ncbi:tectonic-like complex member MKS1 [Galleria mellonella]|uniref:Tectonic-like complex member MKS1 n=1 Tax=Galleria mellonella TaxID=7137 RepID=A0ABM3MKB5_GALME|nr:tectonic-like complex member MKS1 [Galleria mellonella]